MNTSQSHRVSLEITDDRPRPRSLVYVLLVCILASAATIYGLGTAHPYRLVSSLTVATWRAQDAVTLVLMPVLLWAELRARRGSLPAHVVAVGIYLWLAYSFAHLAIGAPVNAMFLGYVTILGLSAFAALDGLLRVDMAAVGPAFRDAPRRAASWFLIIAGSGIAVLWLSDIVPALPDDLPANVHLSELPNPTWVLDLAWVIPMAIGAGLMLRRRHPAAPVVAGATLVMLLVLSVAMLTVTPFALAGGLGDDPESVAQMVAFTVIFLLLGAIEVWLIALGARRMDGVDPDWLRSGWWPGRDVGHSAS